MAKKKKKKAAKKAAAAPTIITVQSATVTPGVATVSKGDQLQWVNNTTDRIIVFFPHDKVLGAGSASNHFMQPIAAGASSPLIKTHKSGSFRYAIYCADDDAFAEGSDPEIIVP